LDKLQKQPQHVISSVEPLTQKPDQSSAGIIIAQNSKLFPDIIETASCIVGSPNRLLGE